MDPARRPQKEAPTPDTAGKLLAAAIESFGHRGFDGTSIREIAKTANVNIASIAYHFGGKEQLYRACLEHITDKVREGVGQIDSHEPRSPEEARESLKTALFQMMQFVLATPEVASFIRVVVREQMDPSPAFDILYEKFMEPLHRRLCGLWALASGDHPESDTTKIAVFSLLGQILLFRIARAGALRRMGWREIGKHQLETLKRRISVNVDLLARSHKGERE